MTIFKSSDIRRRYPGEINETFALRLGYSLRSALQCDDAQSRRIAVGRDARDSSPQLAQAIMQGIEDSGLVAVDIGCCATEMLYFTVFNWQFAGGVMVTASHNPYGYNGFKVVGQKAIPHILKSSDIVADDAMARQSGSREELDPSTEYRQLVYSFCPGLDTGKKPLIACDPGIGSAGDILRTLDRCNLHMVPPLEEGTLTDAAYNPLLSDRRTHTSRAVIDAGADFGVAFDGDGDRCIFFDEHGEYIEPYYIVGLLAEHVLIRWPGSTVVHDTRLLWNTRHIVEKHGGTALPCKGGHAHFKFMMAKTGAAFGGEASGHYFFRDFGNCDSGIIPMVMVAALVQETGKPLSSMVRNARRRFVCTDEISLPLNNPEKVLQRVEEILAPSALNVDHLDGVSMEFEQWRMCLRKSGTESVVRLNLESRNGKEGLQLAMDTVLPLLKPE